MEDLTRRMGFWCWRVRVAGESVVVAARRVFGGDGGRWQRRRRGRGRGRGRRTVNRVGR